MKISILLPYKENFSYDYAGAVSLFVKDTLEKSIFKKSIKIYGNTNYNNYLAKNYININFKKNFLLSTNKLYVKHFLKFENKNNSDLIEVHNRPSYINIISKEYKKKLILYFHNDPLEMNGSKTINERLFLISKLDKIFFNSQWCRNRFFKDIKNYNLYLNKTEICYQSASTVKINFKKKKKIISFVGKLNRSKGYDIFGNAILKILNTFPDWSAHVYGDEPREKLYFKHKNLKIFGFKKNKFILNKLKSISISVVCSRWNEPFGRTSLEAASRGSAVIISKRGGLPETAPYAIKLKSLTSNNLYKIIIKLIKNKKKLINLQKKKFRNFKFTHNFISKKIDDIRLSIFPKKINIRKEVCLKILHLTNFNRRFDGRLQYNTGRRLNNGFVRLGHNVLTLSDRDIIHDNKSLTDFTGKKELQNKIKDNFINFKPDCIILGHADSISADTLNFIKNEKPNIKIGQWFLDPVGKGTPDAKKNNKRIFNNNELIDYTFLTSCPSLLTNKINNSFFIPNPSDISFEVLKNYKKNCNNDVFFAMSHGVHRGTLKKGKFDNREIFINKLIKKLPNVLFDIYGMNNIQPVWGNNFINAISNSQMAINLSRGKPVKYYSSDRIAQLLGNGLLTFVDIKTRFNDFLSENEIIFYSDINDLIYKLKKYKKDKKETKRIARNGRNFYLKHFNSTIVSDFILSKMFDYKSKNKFIWEK